MKGWTGTSPDVIILQTTASLLVSRFVQKPSASVSTISSLR